MTDQPLETPPHLQKTHEQYPDGFPDRLDDSLLGHWETPKGTVVVEDHPHGYEIHFYPCFDFDCCEACAPDRGPSNPHTPNDGHHFRLCENRQGPIFTVAGGVEGYRAILQYLAWEGSAPHIREQAELEVREAEAERRFRAEEAAENERLAAETFSEPSLEERFAALTAEFEDFRKRHSGASS